MAEKSEGRSVCCIGGMSMDRILTLQMPVNLGTSNPVTTEHGRGGAARNVAEHLARLTVPCQLIAIVGDDEDGRVIVLETAQQGVDTGLIQKSLSSPTGSSTCVIGSDGKLFACFADMAVCESMDRAFVQNRWLQIRSAALVFADTNLPADSLALLIEGCREQNLPLVVDAVTTANVRKLPLNLRGVDMLICSIDEARAILGDELARDADTMATALCQRGAVGTVIIDADSLSFANADGCATLPSESPLRNASVEDAFVAGTLYGRLMGHNALTNLRIGLKAASLVAGGDDPNGSPLSVEALTSDLQVH